MTKLLYAASAAALLTAATAVPSLAQSTTSGASTGTMSAPSITCRELSALDRESARGVIYYMSGFQQAMNSGMGMTNQAAGSSGSTTMDSGGSSSTSADAGSTSGTATTGDASGSGSTTADAGSDSATTSGSTDATGSTSSAGTSSSDAGTTGSGTSAGSAGMVAQIPGFQNIDVDRIMSDCQSSPDRRLSDLMMQQSGSGSTAQ